MIVVIAMVMRSGVRKYALLVVFILSAALALSSCGQQGIQDGGDSPRLDDYVPGELLVRFRSDIGTDEIEAVIRESGGTDIIEEIGPEENRTYLIRLSPQTSVEEAIGAFESFDEVEYAEPNYVRTIRQ